MPVAGMQWYKMSADTMTDWKDGIPDQNSQK
ncbi:hypothetical protein Pan5_42 [Pseudanabaena phage Pan5]|nr:hypothetical protein Pan5_42 [Pseudanabaena phage Pan5]